jgi:uncharacterized protein
MKYICENERIYANDEDGNLVAEITFPRTGNNTYTINHTFVDDSLRGQGIAKELVNMAVEKITNDGGKVLATCSYAAHILRMDK